MTDLPATDLPAIPELPLTVTDAAAALRAGTVTSLQLTEAAITRADRHRRGTRRLPGALRRARPPAGRDADAELAAGVDRGPLHGIPVRRQGHPRRRPRVRPPRRAWSSTAAWGAGKDAPVVSRLRAAGAVITGKLTTMEFAIGMPDPTKPFPVPRNPWDPGDLAGRLELGHRQRASPAGMFLAGLGTDTGGSIRIPAAFCGVSGLMPTFGRVPKSGCAPLGYSLDHIGPLARSARDCAAMLSIIAGYDPATPTASTDRCGLRGRSDGGITGRQCGSASCVRTTSPTTPIPRSRRHSTARSRRWSHSAPTSSRSRCPIGRR